MKFLTCVCVCFDAIALVPSQILRNTTHRGVVPMASTTCHCQHWWLHGTDDLYRPHSHGAWRDRDDRHGKGCRCQLGWKILTRMCPARAEGTCDGKYIMKQQCGMPSGVPHSHGCERRLRTCRECGQPTYEGGGRCAIVTCARNQRH